MKSLQSLFWALFFPFVLCCSKTPEPIVEVETPSLGTEATIKSFAVEGFSAKIQGREISLTLPSYVDASSVTPKLTVSSGAAYAPSGAVDLRKAITYKVTSEDGKTVNEYTVTASESFLFLSPNEVFFSPCGTLTAVAESGVAGDALNQGKSYSHVKAWSRQTDTLVWGVDVKKAGKMNVCPVLGVPAEQNGSVVEVRVNGVTKDVVLAATGGYSTFSRQSAAEFDIPSEGRYEIRMNIKRSASPAKEIAYVSGLSLNGPATKGLEPVRLRWRPTAIHAGFSCSKASGNVVLAVHENTIATTGADCYQPITTPFGYYGSTWNSGAGRFGGVNFSLWSFSAGSVPPPAAEFSHLIAVGKGLRIDGFNHEGTGVKARGVNPFEAMEGVTDTQVLAVKKIPGNPYDVYYSYYLDMGTREWVLYACGKKYNSGPLKYLTTGSFVEQPGAAEKQRSNHVMREVDYRGWVLTKDGKWFQIDQMTPTGTLPDDTYQDWGITEDNRFFMKMGGFDKMIQKKPSTLTLPRTDDLPDYLTAEKIEALSKFPAGIEVLEPSSIGSDKATLNFRISEYGTNPVVTVFWGKSDGLTFVDSNVGNGGVVKWDHNRSVSGINSADSSLSIDLTGLSGSTTYYYRLQIVNDEGETWSFDTHSFKTL